MEMEKKGVSERLLRELLKSPKFKTSLKITINEIDPSTARGLVRTIFWEDVETFMGALSALPKVVNLLVQMAHEVALQIDNFPPAILLGFLSQLVGDIDFKAVEETVEEFRVLLEKLQPVVEGLKEASSGVLGQAAAE